MSVRPYSEEQIDALQEIANIAMGQAGASLAKVLKLYIQLSVPRIDIVEKTRVTSAIRNMVDPSCEVTAVRQGFYSRLRGEAIMIFAHRGAMDLAELMGYGKSELDAIAEEELLLDVANILTGACLNGIAQQLDTDLSFTPPSIMATNVRVESFLGARELSWNHALLIEVNFSLREREFSSHLVMLMPEESIEIVRTALTRFLEAV